MAKNYKLYSKRIVSAERIDEIYDVVKKVNNQLGAAKLDLSKELNWTDTAPSGDDEEPIVIPPNPIDTDVDITRKYNELGEADGAEHLYGKYLHLSTGTSHRVINNAEGKYTYVLTGFIPVKENEKYIITANKAENISLVAGFVTVNDANFTPLLTDYNTVSGPIDNVELIIPEGINFIRICGKSTTEDLALLNAPEEASASGSNAGTNKRRLTVLTSVGNVNPDDDEDDNPIPIEPNNKANVIDVTKLYDEIGQIANPSNTSAVLYHKTFDGDSVVSDSSFNMTGYIPVRGGEVFSIYGYIDESKAIVVGYDADKLNPSAIVNALTLSKEVTDDKVYNSTTKLVNGFSFVIPEGITYIRYAACNATHNNYDAHSPMLPQIAVVSEDILKKYNNSGTVATNFINENSYLDNTGAIVTTQNDYIVTGKIPVIKDKRYVISGAVNVSLPVVVGISKTQDEPVIILNAASLQNSPYYNSSTGTFNRYLLEIDSDVTHIMFSAKGANHSENPLRIVPKIECYDYQEGLLKEDVGFDFEDNEEPIDVSGIIPVKINWKDIVTYPDVAADAYAGGENIVKGAVRGDDGVYHGALNIISTTLGGVDYAANVVDESDPTIITRGHDYKHVTGYIPIVDENDNPIYSVIAITVYPYIGSKTPQSVICVGYKEIENNNNADVRHSNGVNNRLVIKGNPYFKYNTYKSIVIGDNGKPVISSPELDEDFTGYNNKESQTYYINLLPYVSKGIKYIRVCSRYRIPKTETDGSVSWTNLSDMGILGYPYKEGVSETKANAFVEETNATVKPNQVKRNAQQVILDEITSKFETEQDIVDTLQLLKDAPREYLSNINTSRLFGATNRRAIVRRYLEDVENGSLDCPNVIKNNITTVSLYPTLSPRISKDSVTELTNRLIPNARYYIADGENVKKLDVVGERKFINGGTIRNIRDLGGIKCKDGNTIAFDKVFRGAAIDDDSYHFLDSLGITAELDLRNVDEGYNEQHYSFTTRYKKVPMPSFTRLSTLSSEQKTNIKEAFLFVNDCVKHNNKLYIHCGIGCHRAGLLSTIIEGVLGAHRSEIDKDYELSSFSGYTLSINDDYDYDNAYNDLVANYDGSWTNFLLDCGVPYERIVEFRNNMLVYPNKEQIVQYHVVTYNQLVNLRNNKGLAPGDKYRMIDYDTCDGAITAYASCSGIPDLPKFKSAYHHFDLLLTALSTNELDSNVKAIYSVRDTEGYFKNQDLAKWEIKYNLDNDRTKYSWAVPNGKGVIYYMKDENNNELPYDFKNIMFEYKGSWNYTFNNQSYNIIIKPWIDNLGQHLNRNVFINGQIIKDCFFDFNTHDNILKDNIINVKVGMYSNSNTLINLESVKLGYDNVNLYLENFVDSNIGNECYNLELYGNDNAIIVEDFTSNKIGGAVEEYTKIYNEIDYSSIEDLNNFTKIYYTNGDKKLVRITGELTKYSLPDRSNIKEVEIGNSVTSIGDFAFGDCSSLTSITCMPVTPPSLGNTAIPSTIATLKVPAQSVDSYKSAIEWSNYADKIVAIQ